MKMAIILNSNQLGGAERSLIEQFASSGAAASSHVYYPDLNLSSGRLIGFLNEKGFKHHQALPYPNWLYKISRSKFSGSTLLFFPGLLVYFFLWRTRFRNYDSFYLNGVKASFPVFFWSFIERRKIKVYWHFRDFPAPGFFRIITKLVKSFKPREQELVLISNSKAVGASLSKIFPEFQLKTIYNLTGELPERCAPKTVKHIGIVSMFAPWKGIHSVVLTLGLYQNELRRLGVEKVSFFGEAIYQTDGDHRDYLQQVQTLCARLGVQIAEFPGLKTPEEIFSTIDLLIHPSLAPEPFGRVILEAFKTSTPVISSALGGAGELVEDQVTGLILIPDDPHQLFLLIKTLAEDHDMRRSLTVNAFKKAQQIEESVHELIPTLTHFNTGRLLPNTSNF